MSNNNLPSILFNAIPKSAGRYCIEALRKGLKLEFSPIGTDMFPQGTLAPVLAMKFNEGGKISHGHIDYWWQPKVLLNAYVDRLLVHLRDPRSTTLEFYYHLLSLKANDWEGSERTGVSWLDLVHPSIKPKKYFELSKEEQIDVQIENCLPHMISFVEGWLDAEQDSEFKPKILFTTYKQLVEDEAAFFDEILDFYAIDKSLFTHKKFTPKADENSDIEGELHYRNAKLEEWREDFTPQQQEKANKMMPKRILERFGWSEK